MGTRKKLLLASLVGLAMVMAFVLGAMPGFDSSRLAASSGQISMADILDFAFEQEKGVDLAVLSAVQAVVVKTPAGDSYLQPEIPLPLSLNASVGTNPVRYVASVEGDNTVWEASANPNNPGGAGTWTSGDFRAFTDPAAFSAPYNSTLDIGSFVTGAASTRSLLLYGLVNASLTSGGTASIAYSSATVDPYEVVLTELDGDVVDVDGNGIPDTAFSEIGDGEIWTATIDLGNGETRTVLVVNLDTINAKGGNLVFSSPQDGITVEAPSVDDLRNSGAVNNDETALLVVQVVEDLSQLIDDADIQPGTENFTDADTWADAVLALAPVSARAAAGPVVDISIIVNGPSGLSEIEALPAPLSVSITLENLAVGAGEELSLFSYPTLIEDGNNGLITRNAPGLQDWTLIQAGLSAGTVSIDTTTLSAFVPFVLPALDITSVTPNTAIEGEEVDLTLTGVIPVATALSIAEAADAYLVTVDGEEAAFRDGPSGAAITASLFGGSNAMYVTWTATAAKGALDGDVEVFDVSGGSPVLLDSLSGAITVTPTFTVTAAAGPNGAVSIDTPANGPDGTYIDGTTVTLTATPDSGFEFVAWQGLLGGESNTATTTITVNADRDLTATFQAEDGGTDQFTLTINRAGNGSGTVSPVTPLLVDENSVVTIVATPASNSKFNGWTGDVANVDDTASATTTVIITGDTTLTANFARKTAADETLTVGSFDAGQDLNEDGQVEVWLFGGETIRLNGTGLIAGADLVSFQVGSNAPVTADLFNVAPDGSFGLVVVPATNATGSEATFDANVTVRRASDNAVFVIGEIVEYKQYATDASDVTTTAFIYDGSPIAVSTGEDNANFATLTLPELDTTDNVFGLVRTGVVDAKKSNTQAIESPINGALESAFAGVIPGFDAATTVNPGTFDVAFYLYGSAADSAKANTGSVGAPAYDQNNSLLTFERGSTGAAGDLPTPGDPEGNQGNAATFEVALADGVLTHADVRDSLTVWGVETAYDYVTDQLEVIANPEVDYQSEVLSGEVAPAVTTDSADATSVDTLTMRLYTLNGFSLRQNVTLTPEDGAGVRLNTQNGTDSDDLAGGKALTIVSPVGGLAWLEKIEFRIGANEVGEVTNFTTVRGDDEYVVQFNAPASDTAGVASIVLTGRANATAIQTVNLANVFEFRGAQQSFPIGILLILLGLLAALIGLAAGGSSGGGGGGPCFIATAAYGTPLDGNIDTLRDVRDEFMLTNALGTAVTDAYYQVSPALADTVASSPMLAAVVRVLLVPVIFLGKMALTSPALLAIVALSIGFFFWSKSKGARKA